MKDIQPLQVVVNNQIAKNLQTSGGLLVTWASTLELTRRGRYEKILEKIHTTTKTHYSCIPPRQIERVKSGKDKVIATSGLNNLTHFDGNTLREVSSLLDRQDIEVICICDRESLRDNEWLSHLLVDKYISFEEIGGPAIATENRSEDMRDVDACLEFARICKTRFKRGCEKRLYFFSSRDESMTKLVASVFFSHFPESLVLAVPISRDEAGEIREGAGTLRLDDSAAAIKETCKTSNSTYYRGKVSAIINLYKRQRTCKEIYQSIVSQTYPVSQIYVWVNGQIDEGDRKDLREVMPLARFVFCDENMGVWARFAFGLNVRTEYSVVFDDDTVPGKRWVENCMHNMLIEEALYGTVGLIYDKPLLYMNHKRYGWPAPNRDTRVVDIVGHSWFFKTDWLRQYWYLTDDIDGTTFCGEDMHFSYALQSIGIKTAVPPHPIDEKELWGSLKGVEAGTGEEAISISGKGSMMDVPLKRLVERGFKLMRF